MDEPTVTPAVETPAKPAAPNYDDPKEVSKFLRSDTERDYARRSGREEAPKSSAAQTGDSAPPEVETPDKPAAQQADPAPASPTKKGEPNPKTHADNERRFQDILEERGRLKQQLETLQEQMRQITEVDDPGSQPGSEESASPRIDDLDDNGQPRFKTLMEWQDALRAYDREQISKQIRAEFEKNQTEQRRAEVDRIVSDGWKKKVAESAKKHSDYDAVALNPDLPIPAGSVIDTFLLDSVHGAEVLYAIGKDNGAELKRISEIKNPMQQVRELFKIEAKVSTPAAVPPKKMITSAPAPPHEIGGSGTVLPDEVEQAAKEAEDDPQAVRRFIQADTRRAIARRKGQ